MTLFILWILFGIVGAAMLSPYGKAGTGGLIGGLLGQSAPRPRP